MKQPEEVKLEFTREWIRKAENDYRTDKYLSDANEEYTYGVTFHSQQAAEKYIKAFLVWHQIEFKKTHDIALLLALASKADPELSAILNDAEELTPYGAEYRYPGDYPDVSAEDSEKTLRLATTARTEIRNRMPAQILA
ncbi:MAG: HEPN domain-containing protein [Pseudomonadota bacterium]